MQKKMTLGEWFDKVRDSGFSEDEFMSISVIRKGSDAFDFEIRPKRPNWKAA